MASRRSHAATKESRLSTSCGFRGAGPISWNPLQAAKQRSCGYVRHIHLNIVPRRGTDASTMMLRMIVGPASRNQERVRWCLSHSCAPSELAVGFWWIRVPSGHGADWAFCYGKMQANEVISAIGGCVAMARRHSLLCLPRLLVNYNKLRVPRSGTLYHETHCKLRSSAAVGTCVTSI